MKILITGSRGQLGRELLKQLREGSSEIGPLPREYTDCQVTGVDMEELDITNREEVFSLVETLSPDLILNCAAYTNVNGCETDYETAFRVNVKGAGYLAEAAEKVGAKFLHLSTDYVFDGKARMPYLEDNPCSPQSAYGRTKLAGEQEVLKHCTRFFIVRTAWLYGYYGNNFVKTILRKARADGTVKVVKDQRGNPTNAVDLAHHLLKLGATNQYGVYHCTGNGECSWYEFACKIVEFAGVDCTVTPCTTDEFPSPAKRPAYSSLSHKKLNSVVGDEMRPWQDALHSFFDHLTAEGISL